MWILHCLGPNGTLKIRLQALLKDIWTGEDKSVIASFKIGGRVWGQQVCALLKGWCNKAWALSFWEYNYNEDSSWSLHSQHQRKLLAKRIYTYYNRFVLSYTKLQSCSLLMSDTVIRLVICSSQSHEVLLPSSLHFILHCHATIMCRRGTCSMIRLRLLMSCPAHV